MLHLLLVLLLSLVAAAPLAAQPVVRLDLPAETRRVLASGPDAVVYATADHLVFDGPAAAQRVPLDGDLVAWAEAADHGAAVAVRPHDDSSSVRVERYAADGRLHFALTLPHAYDAPFPMLAATDDGALASAQPGTADVVFVDADGRETARHRLFREAPYTLERSLRLVASPDGRHVVAAATPGAAVDAASTRVARFTADGRLLWRRDLPGGALQALAAFDDGRLAVSTYAVSPEGAVARRTHVLDAAGRARLDVPHGFEHARLDGDRLLLVTRRQALVLDADGARRLAFDRPAPDVLLLDAALAPDGEGLALLTGRAALTDGGFAYRDVRLLHLDAAGRVAATTVPPAPTVRTPRLHPTPVGLTLTIDDAVLTYPWP